MGYPSRALGRGHQSGTWALLEHEYPPGRYPRISLGCPVRRICIWDIDIRLGRTSGVCASTWEYMSRRESPPGTCQLLELVYPVAHFSLDANPQQSSCPGSSRNYNADRTLTKALAIMHLGQHAVKGRYPVWAEMAILDRSPG